MVDERANVMVIDGGDRLERVGRQGWQVGGSSIFLDLPWPTGSGNHGRDGVEGENPPQRELGERGLGGTSCRSLSTAASPVS